MLNRLAAACLLAAGTLAHAQEILIDEAFEVEGQTAGFTVNGNQMLFGGGNPGMCIGVPFQDFQGIHFGTNEPDNALTGNLSRHNGPIQISVDIAVFQLQNFFGEDMDPHWFPLTMQLFDFSDDPEGVPVSVYITSGTMPRPVDGWVRYTFTIPNPLQSDLPEGWGGTGDEDPETFEPRLPAGRTYASVLASVDQFVLTTFQPGFFYSSNFWQAGFDNLHVTVEVVPGCRADFNGDGLIFPDDLSEFITCFFLQVQFPGFCPQADFNGDGLVFPDDLSEFVTTFFLGCN